MCKFWYFAGKKVYKLLFSKTECTKRVTKLGQWFLSPKGLAIEM